MLSAALNLPFHELLASGHPCLRAVMKACERGSQNGSLKGHREVQAFVDAGSEDSDKTIPSTCRIDGDDRGSRGIFLLAIGMEGEGAPSPCRNHANARAGDG